MEATCLAGGKWKSLVSSNRKRQTNMWPAMLALCCLLCVVSSTTFGASLARLDEANSAVGQQESNERGVPVDGEPKQQQRQQGALEKLMLEWQLEQILGQALEQQQQQQLHERIGQSATVADQLRALYPQTAQSLQTIPRPSHRSTSLSWPNQLSPPTVHLAGLERRNSPNLNGGMGSVLDQLSAIESLNSLLDDGNLSRLGRAYKPKTMSTARGFGKRSMAPWRPL